MRTKPNTPEIKLSASGYRILCHKVEGLRDKILTVSEYGLLEFVDQCEMELEPYRYLMCYHVPRLTNKLEQIKNHDATRRDIVTECNKLIKAVTPLIDDEEDLKIAASI